MAGQLVAALDVGTTSVRCHILDKSTACIGKAEAPVHLQYPAAGRVEMDPEQLWDTIVAVIRDAIRDSGVSAWQISCLGISTQRGSFTVWDRNTGKPYCNFITWKDLRADSLVRKWNKSYAMKSLRGAAKFLYTIFRRKKLLSGSVHKFTNSQVTLRLLWALENIPGLRADAKNGTAMFGTVDTWLLYRLTGGKHHVTDFSNASATGIYDPWARLWWKWSLDTFKIPVAMLPRVVDSAGDFGCVSGDILGAPIPIRCSMADQSASMYGSCCFKHGELKVTLGTGAFVDVNTGRKPHASTKGLYPLIGWKVGEELVYVMEGGNADTGSLVTWAVEVGLLSEPEAASNTANSVPNSNGMFFIPAFSGLQAPINDSMAAAGFIGLKAHSRREHMVRAVLESIVFRIVQLYKTLLEETKCSYTTIRLDGGVAGCDFVAQLLADMTGLQVERAKSIEMSVLGAGFLAGLHAGVWSSKDELVALRQVDRVFHPRENVGEEYRRVMTTWTSAMDRFLGWHQDQPCQEH